MLRIQRIRILSTALNHNPVHNWNPSLVLFRNEKRKILNPMVQRSKNIKKFKGRGGDGDGDSSEEEAEKRRATQLVYGSSGAVVEKTDQNATAIRQVDTELEKDQRAITERSEQVATETKGQEDDKIYRGINNYAKYIDKKESLIGKRMTIKPIRAPTNVRSTVRWDYEPMLCKDYKETGYCGFGDTCKFMHDRSDYKHGWQMDKEFEAGDFEESDDEKYAISDEDDLPHKCGICRGQFTNPVSTRCKHYFCEACALAHYRKSQRCALCGQQTNGMFNPAKDLVERMEKWAAEGRNFESEEEDDERLPDESKPSIPEDDPNYYGQVHDPHT
ncbi:RING finger protein 113A [Eurytemora carolleeae]|uniref:RING finger protein 113A n=1 Tax=Eurytemora carolleeae TaxID=1294199 RepID=UPI000C790157|nr:RING finger protein 113A [Eurytemora carolleeae]|eukprot:XP_023336983.1 RING finger protein 113A-like [Eurytemora affinis]